MPKSRTFTVGGLDDPPRINGVSVRTGRQSYLGLHESMLPKTTTGLRPNTPEHDAFLKSCEDVYKTDQAKLDKTNPKDILGATKPMLGLNPRVALLWMAKAFEFGAHGRDANGVQVRPKGYGEYNWRDRHVSEMVYVHAMERHIADYLDGQDLAADSKVKHLGHIMACAAILLDAEECGAIKRDRPKPGKAADLIERMTINKDSAKTELPSRTLTEQWFQDSYNALLKEIDNDTSLNLTSRVARSSKRRGKGRRQGKADRHGRGRKARQ